jgi:hypothetical protein
VNDNERNFKILNSNSDLDSDIVTKTSNNMIPRLSFFDPSDAFDISPKGSPTCLTFHAENVYKSNF